MKTMARHMVVALAGDLSQSTLELWQVEIKCEIVDIFFLSLQSLQEDVDLAEIAASTVNDKSFFPSQRMTIGQDLPASELNYHGTWLDPFGNLVSVGLQDLDLGIGEVVLVQVGDLLEEPQASLIV